MLPVALMAVNYEQGRHYLRRLFPDESTRSRRVKIVTEEHHVLGARFGTAIMVGEYRPHGSDKMARLWFGVKLGGCEPIQGPRR